MGYFNVFVRNWWTVNPSYPGGLEPCPGRRHYLKRGVCGEDEARSICQVWNANHAPGKLSRKAEYEACTR